jgi:hypothetical protein
MIGGDWKAALARELGAPALHDEGVEAARNACVAGASIAAAAITAAAWYDNPLTGVGALRRCLARLSALPFEVDAWRVGLRPGIHPETGDPGFSPGFGFVDGSRRRALLEACGRLARSWDGPSPSRCAFFHRHHESIEASSGPLNQTGLAALCFADRGLDAGEAERLFLLLRMEIAMAEAERARARGVRSFPFFSERYRYEGARPAPAVPLDLPDLMRQVGLD